MTKHNLLNQCAYGKRHISYPFLLIFGLLFASCSGSDTSVETNLSETPTAQITVNTRDTLSFISPTVSSSSTPTLRPDVTVVEATQTPQFAPTPTLTPSVLSSSTPASRIPLADVLIAAIEIKNQGMEDEIHDLWLTNTATEEKQLLFSTSLGTRLTTMKWGGAVTNFIYILEIKGVGEGNISWQLYEVDYETGSSRPFFEQRIENFPKLLDISAQGKWLRILVEDLESGFVETWFVETTGGQTIKTEKYFKGFVWSPNNSDVFAYSQNVFDTGEVDSPQSVIISDVMSLSVLDSIDYEYTTWGGEPWLVWTSSEPNHILFLVLGQMFIVDLVEKEWSLIAQNIDVAPGDGPLSISPSGKWLSVQGATLTVSAIQLQSSFDVAHYFDAVIPGYHVFLSWYDNEDWMIIATQDARVQIWTLDDGKELLREISLDEFGINSQGLHAILAKALIEHGT